MEDPTGIGGRAVLRVMSFVPHAVTLHLDAEGCRQQDCGEAVIRRLRARQIPMRAVVEHEKKPQLLAGDTHMDKPVDRQRRGPWKRPPCGGAQDCRSEDAEIVHPQMDTGDPAVGLAMLRDKCAHGGTVGRMPSKAAAGRLL
jgi:hypothetical protein